jgi:hypothetical protein
MLFFTIHIDVDEKANQKELDRQGFLSKKKKY